MFDRDRFSLKENITFVCEMITMCDDEKTSSRNEVYSSRADNWLVDTGSDPVEHNGLSDFGKVRISP